MSRGCVLVVDLGAIETKTITAIAEMTTNAPMPNLCPASRRRSQSIAAYRHSRTVIHSRMCPDSVCAAGREAEAIGRSSERCSTQDCHEQGNPRKEDDDSARFHEYSQHVGTSVGKITESKEQTETYQVRILLARIGVRVGVIAHQHEGQFGRSDS